MVDDGTGDRSGGGGEEIRKGEKTAVVCCAVDGSERVGVGVCADIRTCGYSGE